MQCPQFSGAQVEPVGGSLESRDVHVAEDGSPTIRSVRDNDMARFVLLGLVLLMACASLVAAEPVSFEREVLPLLERRCNKCHHDEEPSGGLDLTRIETIRRGGDDLGSAIVPGKPDESPLIQVLTGLKEPAMPEQADPLGLYLTVAEEDESLQPDDLGELAK
jgi:hypothetical protein